MKKISRVTRTKEEAKQYYNKISKWYYLISGRSESKLNKEGLEKINIEKGEDVLEIGYGTGEILKEIIDSVGSKGKIYGIDISEEMKKKTLSKIEEEKLKRVQLDCGDAIKLPYKTEIFDAIFISFTLELFDTPEIPIVLKECKRVLKKNGRMCVISMSKNKNNLIEKLYEWSHNRFPRQIDCRPIYTESFLTEAEFKIMDRIERSIFGLAVDIIIVRK